MPKQWDALECLGIESLRFGKKKFKGMFKELRVLILRG